MENKQLRQAGLKATLPRIKILQILENCAERHLSAETIYKALSEANEDVGLATVYRVLTQFEAAGLVIRQNFDGGHSVFELAQGSHHDHMICIDTGKIIEFCNPEIEAIQKDIAKSFGYEIVDHNLTLYVRKLKNPKQDK